MSRLVAQGVRLHVDPGYTVVNQVPAGARFVRTSERGLELTDFEQSIFDVEIQGARANLPMAADVERRRVYWGIGLQLVYLDLEARRVEPLFDASALLPPSAPETARRWPGVDRSFVRGLGFGAGVDEVVATAMGLGAPRSCQVVRVSGHGELRGSFAVSPLGRAGIAIDADAGLIAHDTGEGARICDLAGAVIAATDGLRGPSLVGPSRVVGAVEAGVVRWDFAVGRPPQLMAPWPGGSRPTWARGFKPAGESVWFTAEAQLWAVTAGQELVRVLQVEAPAGTTSFADLSVSPSGRWLAAAFLAPRRATSEEEAERRQEYEAIMKATREDEGLSTEEKAFWLDGPEPDFTERDELCTVLVDRVARRVIPCWGQYGGNACWVREPGLS